MALDREERYASAAAMLQALREAGHLIAMTTPEAPLPLRPQTQEELGLRSQSRQSEWTTESLPESSPREQPHPSVMSGAGRRGESKRRTDAAPAPAPQRPMKAIIIDAALALPVVALAIYFAIIAGRSSAAPSSEQTELPRKRVGMAPGRAARRLQRVVSRRLLDERRRSPVPQAARRFLGTNRTHAVTILPKFTGLY
jgi:hypothetical protein